jgi:hypothetical protein
MFLQDIGEKSGRGFRIFVEIPVTLWPFVGHIRIFNCFFGKSVRHDLTQFQKKRPELYSGL